MKMKGGYILIIAPLRTINKMDSMICIKCDKSIPDDAVYCPYCGKRQEPERKHRKRANGTGNISKLSGNRKKPWCARRNGVCIGTFATRAEAQKALERITDAAITDKYNMTFAQVYERWSAEHSRGISDKMIAGYALAYSQCEQLHNMQMRKILRSDFQAAVIRLEEHGKSKSTCDKLRTLLGTLGRWAVNEGITQTNAAEKLTTTAKQKTTRETFREEDIRRMKESKLPAADIALILISCGCRPGELFKVPLSSCFADHFVGGSKTDAGKNRVIPIGPDGMEAYGRMRIRAIASGGELLIDGYSGNRKAENFAGREWKELMEEIGRPGMTPYSTRHTFVTRAILSGVDLPVLEAIVGHVDRETTKIYTHLRAGDLVSAVQNMESDNFPVCNKSVTRKNGQSQKVG